MENLDYFVGIQNGSRLLAAIIDNFVALFFSVICGMTTYHIIDFNSTFDNFIVFCLFYLLYYFIMENYWSRTIGKMITGLEITNKEGGKINTQQALIRTIFRIIEVNPILIDGLPAALIIIFSKRKQRLGDMLADTVVNYKYD